MRVDAREVFYYHLRRLFNSIFMTNPTGAATIEEALLAAADDASDEADASHLLPLLCEYFVSEEDMRKLEMGVDMKEMRRLLTFLSDGLKRRPTVLKRVRPRLELVFDDEDFSQPSKVERAVAKEVFTPLEIDWEDFFQKDKPKSGIKKISDEVRDAADDAVTPVTNLDVHGEAFTPNIAIEVADNFTMKQRLLYKDLPEETYLLLAMGTHLESLLEAAEKFRQQNPAMTQEQFLGLCANMYRGYAVRYYYQLVQREEAFGDGMDKLVSAHLDRVQKEFPLEVFPKDDMEAHLAALFLVHEKKRRNTESTEVLYNQFVRTSLFDEVA